MHVITMHFTEPTCIIMSTMHTIGYNNGVFSAITISLTEG